MDYDLYKAKAAKTDEIVYLFLSDKSCSDQSISNFKSNLSQCLNDDGSWDCFTLTWGTLYRLCTKIETSKQFAVAKCIREELLSDKAPERVEMLEDLDFEMMIVRMGLEDSSEQSPKQ